jgi:uncharacterized protein (DUF885 family)
MRKFIFMTLTVVSLWSCGQGNKTSATVAKADVKGLCENYYQERLKLFPLEATQAGDLRYNDLYPNDISEAYRATLREFFTKYKKQLEALSAESIDANDKASYDILKWECDISLEGLNLPTHLLPINQFDADHLALPQMGSGAGVQPFKNVKDYDDWASRASKFAIWADTAIANMRLGIAKGIVLPQMLAAKVSPQLKEVIQPTEKSIFWSPIKDMPKDFAAADKKRLTEVYKKLIVESINPAYQRLYDFIQKDYLPKCRTTSGIGGVPQGAEMYKFLAKQWTTTTLTPDEIFETGQREVARIRGEMEKIKEQVAFKGDLKAFFAHVNQLPALHPYTKDQQAIESFNQIHERMKPQLLRLFDVTPKSGFEVRQTEVFREASASAEYMQGSPDGTRPGIFYCPVLNPKDYNVFQDEALFLHEAIPGHHYQCSLQQENTDLPTFRRFLWYGAYGEGWALYTESLGKELGLYSDPYQYFGRLGMEMHRSIRLVVDVGMHYKGWTREQAIAYSLENEAETEENTIAEVERYMAIPGQALSYKIGQLKIAELRKKAETELGAKFDIRKFHNEILKYGCLPLATLETTVNQWIKANK